MVSLDGFRVVSSLPMDDLSCEDLRTDVRQLGIALYPPELINEKFLIKLRECVLNLPESHPSKRWLKSVATVPKRDKQEQETAAFLSEVLNSRFNLITDADVRTKIINHLLDIPGNTLGERLLSSYLYLIIGNITRSDNLLLEFVRRPPVRNWMAPGKRSFFHELAKENIEQIVLKLAGHPADRRIYHLFTRYLLTYYKNPPLLTLIGDNAGPDLKEQLELKYIEKVSPPLVHHLRLLRESESGRMLRLMNLNEIPLLEQAYWHWPFLESDPMITSELIEVLKTIERDDELWFLYLMDSEKLVDIYVKKTGRALLPGRRQFLRRQLESRETFMLGLFKLIELGDIDEALVNKVIDHLAR